MSMWPFPLNVNVWTFFILAFSFVITLLVTLGPQGNPCLILLTGESVRISGCALSAEHIIAISQLKALQVDL
jgi:hypothetical protein